MVGTERLEPLIIAVHDSPEFVTIRILFDIAMKITKPCLLVPRKRMELLVTFKELLLLGRIHLLDPLSALRKRFVGAGRITACQDQRRSEYQCKPGLPTIVVLHGKEVFGSQQAEEIDIFDLAVPIQVLQHR